VRGEKKKRKDQTLSVPVIGLIRTSFKAATSKDRMGRFGRIGKIGKIGLDRERRKRE